jgi:PAS domain S-box-containing protein/putative nucleotidyltransferase with HDIG domain
MGEKMLLDKPMDGVIHFNLDLNSRITSYCENFKEKFSDNFIEDELSLEYIFKGDSLEDVQKYNDIVVNTKTYSYKRHLIGNESFVGEELLFLRFPTIENHQLVGLSVMIYLDEKLASNHFDLINDHQFVDDPYDSESFTSVTDPFGNFQYVSKNASRILGHSNLEMLGKERAAFMDHDHRQDMLRQFDSYFNNRLPVHGLQNIVKTKDGKYLTFVSNAKPRFNSSGTFVGYVVSNHNITNLVRSEHLEDVSVKEIGNTIKSVKVNYERMNHTLRELTDVQYMVSKISKSFMRTQINQLSETIDESLGLIGKTVNVDRVYIFMLNEDSTKMSNTYEWCNNGIESAIDMLQDLDVAIFPWSMKHLALDETINIFDIDLMSSDQTAEKEILKLQGIKSLLLVPLQNEGELIGFLGFDSVKENKKWDSEVSMIKVLAELYALTLNRMKNEKLLVTSIQKTNLLLEQTIQAFASIVEINDPYTSGHQNRTAELAEGIARKLGLDKEAMRTLHYSALLHDLGKFYIPAQILNKPGKLSEIEFSLIKTHPSLGYQVLTKIDFPWPVADIVIQHHERIDGSGYPYGLIGNEIMFEARILAVADVVESMSSHRPYRPALGIHAALDEIRKNKGVIYDSKVVSACIELFEKDGFKFSAS